MKSKRSLWFSSALVGLFISLCSFARAEPVTLSRTEAFELHAALSALSPGLSPENMFAAADAINALESPAKSFRLAYAKLLQLQQAANAQGATPETLAKFREEDAKFSAEAERKTTYEIPLLNISKDELKAASNPPNGQGGITVAQLAIIRRLLKADPPKDAKK